MLWDEDFGNSSEEEDIIRAKQFQNDSILSGICEELEKKLKSNGLIKLGTTQSHQEQLLWKLYIWIQLFKELQLISLLEDTSELDI